VAAPGVAPELLVKVPPVPPSSQVADVALPPYVPPSAPVVPPWQTDIAEPALTHCAVRLAAGIRRVNMNKRVNLFISFCFSG